MVVCLAPVESSQIYVGPGAVLRPKAGKLRHLSEQKTAKSGMKAGKLRQRVARTRVKAGKLPEFA
jgi:hypothetical protein